jgi:hypothetical protein
MPELQRSAYVLDDSEHQWIFREKIFPKIFGKVRSVEEPIAYFVGAQPGAGKSRIQESIRIMLEAHIGSDAVVEIIGDDYRVYHPAYRNILNQHHEQAAFYTDIDSGKWVELAIIASQQVHAHVVIEGTLRRYEITLQTAQSYRNVGFATELHVIAVHEYVSRFNIIKRYLQQLERYGSGRYTIRSAHDMAYGALLDSLVKLTESKVFDRISLYNADGFPIIETKSDESDVSEKLRKVLSEVRRTPSKPFDELRVLLPKYLDLAKRYGKKECLNDLLDLQSTMGYTGK